MRKLTLILTLLSIILFSCAKEKEVIEVIEEKEIELQMIDAYNEAKNYLDNEDFLNAAKKFSEAELLFPQSQWAAKAALMAAYSYYSDQFFTDAIFEIERFLKTYPKHNDTDYAYYLLAITYYDQIVDEARDLDSILMSKKFFEIVIKNYPKTDYALDSKFKLELINEFLASKEMYLARYYFEKQKWIPAINRFKSVVKDYNETIFIEEALHRLVEIHYKIGLEDEAKKYAYLLGYNYQSSEWYENTYKVFNKKYISRDKRLKLKNNKKSLVEKIKSKIF
tara:strand:- start:4190 stop:5029 length:840 start_codon:yes stop_codon:yes gene_type:complete